MNGPEPRFNDDFLSQLPAELRPEEVLLPPHGDQHLRRRECLAAWIAAQGGGVVVLCAGEEIIRNRDNPFPFRSHSDFLYMTGFPEPDAWWIMRVDAKGESESILACRPRDPEREIWDGVRVGPQRAAERFHMDRAISIESLDDTIIELAANMPAFYAHMGIHAELDEKLRHWLNALRAKGRAGVNAPDRIVDISQAIARQRLIKDNFEVATMQRAADISAQAHRRAMRFTTPGHHEFEIEAELLHHFRAAGAQSVAYGSIVASGPHSCILHHRAGSRRIRDAELVLIDAGCELDGYASDITRTYPASGKFSGAQRAVYDVVVAAQEAAIAATRPGAAFSEPHDAAVRVLAQGMMDLKLVKNQSLDGLIESGDYKRFYMHRTGHFLGLDVHDVGDVNTPLAQGMVMTIEPGFYIRPAADIAQEFWNIGIRIEDDALVTAEGARLLTRGVPVNADEIEGLMRG
ncbi:MAG: M24 family metallopeptidase [Burkholderiaceae bacterium]|nr:M24 family metallopeptidase [Burkholderiaceae bacterium]